MWNNRRNRQRSRFFRRRNENNSNNENAIPSSGTSLTSSLPTIRVIDSRQLPAAGGRGDEVSRQQRRKSLSLLYALCKQWAWPAVEFRCHTHPQEASVEHQDGAGDNCLHWVCFGKPPLETVTTLLEICPELASCPNTNGSLPIHVACSYRASSDVIREVLRAYPDGASKRDRPKGRGGSFPLHMLCDSGSSIDALTAVLETKQGLSTLNSLDGVYRQPPLALLNARKNMSFFVRDLQKLRRERARLGGDDSGVADGSHTERGETAIHDGNHEPLYSMEFWQKAALLISLDYNLQRNSGTDDLQSIMLAEENSNHNDYIVHACVGLAKCPGSLLEFAMLLHPEQLMEPDPTSNGQLPLHIAAGASGHQLGLDSSRFMDVLLSSPKPAVRVRDNNGKLPLELAIESGKTWKQGIGALVAAWPPTLEVLFLPDELYPYIWSKLLKLPHHDGISCVYESIRAKPSIIKRNV